MRSTIIGRFFKIRSRRKRRIVASRILKLRRNGGVCTNVWSIAPRLRMRCMVDECCVIDGPFDLAKRQGVELGDSAVLDEVSLGNLEVYHQLYCLVSADVWKSKHILKNVAFKHEQR